MNSYAPSQIVGLRRVTTSFPRPQRTASIMPFVLGHRIPTADPGRSSGETAFNQGCDGFTGWRRFDLLPISIFQLATVGYLVHVRIKKRYQRRHTGHDRQLDLHSRLAICSGRCGLNHVPITHMIRNQEQSITYDARTCMEEG
jgi:hypothetical protein